MTNPNNNEIKPEADRMLSIPEVMEKLGLGRTTVYRMIGEGEMPSIQLGRARRVRLSVVNAIMGKGCRMIPVGAVKPA